MRVQEMMGLKVREKITGFEGIVTGYCIYISGCNQALVAPATDENGKHVEAMWWDEQRLDVIGTDRVTLDNGDTPGCDIPAPVR